MILDVLINAAGRWVWAGWANQMGTAFRPDVKVIDGPISTVFDPRVYARGRVSEW